MMSFLQSIPLGDSSLWVTFIICMVWLASYQYYKNTYTYWKKQGVKGPTPWPIVMDLREFLSDDRLAILENRTGQYGRVYGTFFLGKPCVYISDAEVMRQVCIKDFDNFSDHQGIDHANKFQKNFISWLKGDHWKRVRALVTPSFTSGKMRRMFKLIDTCADDLVDHAREQLRLSKSGDGLVDLIEMYGMYTMDGITTCCYGLRLRRNNEGTGRKAAARNLLVYECKQVTSLNMVRVFISLLVPKFLLNLVGFEISPVKEMRALLDRVEAMVAKRRETPNKYDDLLQTLVDAKLDDKLEVDPLDRAENHHANLSDDSLTQYQDSMKSQLAEQKNVPNILSDLEILSQAAFLLVVGLDTTRMSLSTISYLLAYNPQVQDRLFDELVKIAKYEQTRVGQHLVFDYDELTACQYLDAVVSESLRFFSPAPQTDRRTNADYLIEKYNIRVKAGSRLILGIHSLHRDPDYWPEPDRFEPDRFMPGRKENIVPGSYAPFSMGPRHCVGMRFSLMETKIGLAKMLMNFRFEPAPGTEYPPKPARGLGLVKIRNCRARLVAR